MNNLGVMLAHQQRFSESEQTLAEAARILAQFGDRERHRLSVALGNLGSAYYAEARRNGLYGTPRPRRSTAGRAGD